MARVDMSHADGAVSGPLESPAASSDEARLVGLVTEHFTFVWRTLRRLGVCSADADDAAQQVFMLVAKKLPAIDRGRERAFVFGTTLRVATGARRKRDRRHEISDDDVLERLADPAPAPDELVQLQRARDVLDSILDGMDTDLAAVFVLFEIEQLTMAEIAQLLDLRPGTVASRLRRAREEFDTRLKRLEARSRFRGGLP
jgi:RNA polymerase sigma-70 factor (ECF subfamily)